MESDSRSTRLVVWPVGRTWCWSASELELRIGTYRALAQSMGPPLRQWRSAGQRRTCGDPRITSSIRGWQANQCDSFRYRCCARPTPLAGAPPKRWPFCFSPPSTTATLDRRDFLRWARVHPSLRKTGRVRESLPHSDRGNPKSGETGHVRAPQWQERIFHVL